MFNDEYIDFKFGSYWASDFNLVAVSSSDRYSPPTHGNISSNTTSVAGKIGVYKYKTQVQEKIFTIHIAYDNVPVEYIPKIRQWLNPFAVQRLIFNDEPYKFYYACLNTDPEFTYLPFLEGYDTVGNVNYQNGVIKGEGVLTFVCIDNHAYSENEGFNNPNLVYFEYTEDPGMMPENKTYYENLITDTILTSDSTGAAYLDIKRPSNSSFHSDINYEEHDFDFEEATPEERYAFLLSNAYGLDSGAGDGVTGYYKPWVRMSNLFDYDNENPNFYRDNNIYTKSIYSQIPETHEMYGENVQNLTLGANNDIVYLVNNGNVDANLIMTFDVPNITDGNPLLITIYEDSLKNDKTPFQWNNLTKIVSQISISYFGNYRPYQSFIASHTDGEFVIVIDSELNELFFVDTVSGDKLNLSKFNDNQSFLFLKSCNLVDYSKPFPTQDQTLVIGDTALRKTKFNRVIIGNGYTLNHVNLKWKHTYL